MSDAPTRTAPQRVLPVLPPPRRDGADGERQAVAKAHLALVYREKRGLVGWVGADGITATNGAALWVDHLPVGSPTDDWRVNYIRPDGSYFSR